MNDSRHSFHYRYSHQKVHIEKSTILSNNAFNLLPIPPLDGGRVLRGLVSESIGQYLDRIEPFGLIIMVLLLVSGLLWVLVSPMLALVRSLIVFVVRL